jgi:Spy/CpxP family protein refolding chaperone
MRTARLALLGILALTIAGSVLAADKKAEKKAPPCPAAQRIERWTQGLTITGEQKPKFDALCKEFGPQMKDVMKKSQDVLTPEQKKVQAEAGKAAKDAGKAGKDYSQAVAAAVKLTDEQKAQQATINKEMGGLEKDLRQKVMAVLTPEQQEQIKKKAAEAKKAAK